MMKKLLITGLITVLSLVVMSTGCDQRQASGLKEYTVTCTLDSKIEHDSATLLVLEEDYNKLRVCGTAQAHDGTFSFKGQIDGPHAAIIRWGNDSTKPFHFVLQAGNIHIVMKPGAWRISGSKLNSEYQQFIHKRNAIMNARVATWQDYLNAAAKSSLKLEDEVRLVKQDSLLNDSLQRITVERINRGDAVGRIIRERFAGQLDQQHARMLH